MTKDKQQKKPTTKPTKSEVPSIKDLSLEMAQAPLVEFNPDTGEFQTKNLHVKFLVHLTAGGDKRKIKELLKDPKKINQKLMSDPYGNVALALYARALFNATCMKSQKDPLEWAKIIIEMKKKGLMEVEKIDEGQSFAKTERSRNALGEVIDLAHQGKDPKR